MFAMDRCLKTACVRESKVDKFSGNQPCQSSRILKFWKPPLSHIIRELSSHISYPPFNYIHLKDISTWATANLKYRKKLLSDLYTPHPLSINLKHCGFHTKFWSIFNSDTYIYFNFLFLLRTFSLWTTEKTENNNDKAKFRF